MTRSRGYKDKTHRPGFQTLNFSLALFYYSEKIKTFVGWVEERNPTPAIPGLVGFRRVSTQPTHFYFLALTEQYCNVGCVVARRNAPFKYLVWCVTVFCLTHPTTLSFTFNLWRIVFLPFILQATKFNQHWNILLNHPG